MPELYPYQRVGSAFLATARAALNGDDMGVGKTPETIRAVQLLAAAGESVTPALIVCPRTVKKVWAEKLAEWAPELRVTVPKAGTPAAVAGCEQVRAGQADVLVLNYEALANVSRLAPYGSVRLEGCTNCDPLSNRSPARCQRERKAANEIPWRTVIADEAHNVLDPKAQRVRALWALADGAEFRFALTGTPPEDPSRLWTLMRFVSPGEFARKSAFVDRYVETAPNIWSGFDEAVGFRADRREEFDRFFLPRFIRRPKAAVLPDLPPKTYLRRDVELGQKQRRAYDQFREGLIAEVNNGTIFALNPLAKVTRLRQFACSFATVNDAGGVDLDEPSSKLDDLEDVLAELGNRQAVIYAVYKDLLRLAEARLGTVGRITGDENDAQRSDAVDKFRAGDLQLMLCTFGAGGEGIDGLQVADTVILLQRSWSPSANKQAEDRLHRLGQNSNVTVVDLVTVDTVEERVLATLEEKGARFEDLVRDADMLRRWLA